MESNVLYLTHRVPYPPNRGDRIRTYHVLRFLARYADVHLGCLADEPPEPGAIERLESECATVHVEPVHAWSRRLRAAWSLATGWTASEGAFRVGGLVSAVRRLASETRFDAVLLSSSALAPYAELRELGGVPLFVDLIDVDSQKWLDYAAATSGPMSLLYRTEGCRMRRLESGLADRARGLFVVSEAEADLYRSFRPDGPIHAIPNGVDLDYFTPPAAPGTDGCVFVGAMDYKPNVDAVRWFCDAIWPAVRAAHPEAMFRIVGREPTPAVRALAERPGVEVTGSVPDVRPFVARAAVTVVPLQIARGVQNKLLEAMAMQSAIVCSPGPLNGVDVVDGEHLVCAENADDWLGCVNHLLDDAAERRRLGRNAGRWVRRHHTWDACLSPLAGLLPFDAFSGARRLRDEALVREALAT